MAPMLQAFGPGLHSAHSQTLVIRAGSAAEILSAPGYRTAFWQAKAHRKRPLNLNQDFKNMVVAQGLRTSLPSAPREACWNSNRGKRQVSKRVIFG